MSSCLITASYTDSTKKGWATIRARHSVIQSILEITDEWQKNINNNESKVSKVEVHHS